MSRMITRLFAPVALGLLTLAATSRRAAAADPCPPVGSAFGCNIIFTIGAGGVVTQSFGIAGLTPYDGVEDNLVGVINNSGGTLVSLALSGNDIFGFDGDGICAPASTFPNGGVPNGSLNCTWAHPFGYEGPNTSFSVTNNNTGSVNFTGGLASGGTAFFSLEEPPSANGITIQSVTVTPEPATVALFATGLIGMVGVVRRRRTDSNEVA